MLKLSDLPKLPQRQDALNTQLDDLRRVASRLGMYDAADALTQVYGRLEAGAMRYGCHCDLEPDMEPDGCVIDEGALSMCIHAKPGMRKEQCEYWRPVAAHNAEINPRSCPEKSDG